MLRFAIVVAATLACSLAYANEVIVSPSQDSTIYGEDSARSNGAGDFLFTGSTDDGAVRRAPVKFDLIDRIPSGSTIDSVTLVLTPNRTRTDPTEISLHRLTAAWGEAGSDAPMNEGQGDVASEGDATWSHAIWPTIAWSAAGGDFVAAASASTGLQLADSTAQWSGGGLVADVQAWLDAPADNHGWIVVGDESVNQTAVRFGSRTQPKPALRPVLRVEFTPTGPSGACCHPDGGCGETGDPPTTCPDYEGVGTTCDVVSCPQPDGACCLPDALGTCAEVTEADCLGQGGAFAGGLSSCADRSCPVVLTPFVDPLPLPAVATPTAGFAGGAGLYTISMVELHQQLHRDLPDTRVWGFSDGTTASYPGPTIEASTGAPVTVTWVNDLRDDSGELRQEHVLNVDTCVHGADDQLPRTVVHLHGGHVPAAYDGHPELTILPGEETTYVYPNEQPAAPIWYHDHALGITRLNVYMGLAGLYHIRDDEERALDLPAGPYEVPLVIQDRKFSPDGQLEYPTGAIQHFFGDTILVNGKVWPYLNVRRGKYRFRLLNGSGSRTYTLSLSNDARFDVIGTDGGLLPSPVGVADLTIMPGERYDIVIDFAPFAAGTQIVLENSASAPYPGPRGQGVVPNVLQFIVGSEPGHTNDLPDSLRAVEPIPEEESIISRDFILDRVADTAPAPGRESFCGGVKWLINGLGWHDITEKPRLGTTEIWRFVNPTGIAHPMHMHLVFFQVLDHQPIEVVDGIVAATGAVLPPRSTEGGWHDTIEVGPGEAVRVIARFEDYTGLFAYHCHILEHEDHEMMRQFEAFTECGDGALGQPDESCDDGNFDDGDGCDSNCTPTACGNGVTTDGEQCDDGNQEDGDGCEADCSTTPSPGDMGLSPDLGTQPTDTGTPRVAGGGCCGVAAAPVSEWWPLILLGLLWRRRAS